MVRWLGILVGTLRSCLSSHALRAGAREPGPDGFAGDGFAVHAPASAAAVAGMARVSDEPCQRSDRVGFLHGADGDLSSALCADRAEPPSASAGAFQCH